MCSGSYLPIRFLTYTELFYHKLERMGMFSGWISDESKHPSGNKGGIKMKIYSDEGKLEDNFVWKESLGPNGLKCLKVP